jgi:hypothetical protein
MSLLLGVKRTSLIRSLTSANDPKRTFPWPQLSVYTHIINGLKLLQRGHRKIVKGAAAGAFQSHLRLGLSHAPGLAFYRLHCPARDSRARLYLMAQEESRSGRSLLVGVLLLYSNFGAQEINTELKLCASANIISLRG